MRFWYKKNKITLQDISHTKQEGPKGAHEEVLISKIIEVPVGKENEESKFESKEGSTKANKNEEESKQLHASMEPHVEQ